jgi:Tol biopolymer transport system component
MSRSDANRPSLRATFAGLAGAVTVASAILLSGGAAPALAAPLCAPSGADTVCTFSAPGADTFMVPPGVTKASLDVFGAQGGGLPGQSVGGRGGRARAELALMPGATVTVVVGGAGGSVGACDAQDTPGAGGVNGGAPGGSGFCEGAGGGGASDVRIGGTDLTDRVLVAGGGGGGANRSEGLGDGGAGGGLNGGPAGDILAGGGGGGGGNPCDPPVRGSGGDQTGVSGSCQPGDGSAGADGSLAGGGGGGGFYGGAGGGPLQGGGGGSGFGPPGVLFETGVHSGDGLVTVTYSIPADEIVFASSRTGNGDIYAITPGQGAAPPRQLTTGNAVDAEPVWSPDRSKVAFTSTRDGNVEIYVMDAGGDVTRLTSNSAVDTSPAWSPDGSKLAFASTRTNGRFDVYTMNPDGSGVQRLTINSAADTFPEWSPNGAKIAFSSARTGNGDIYALNVATKAETRLTNSSGVDTGPAWHGGQIAFSTNRHGLLNFELYRRNDSPGGTEVRLTNDPRPDVTPAWSPDGTQLAFASNRDGGANTEIYTINADGTNPQRQSNHPGLDLFPDW